MSSSSSQKRRRSVFQSRVDDRDENDRKQKQGRLAEMAQQPWCVYRSAGFLLWRKNAKGQLQVLLGRSNSRGKTGQLNFLGGKREFEIESDNIDSLATAIREFKEEARWDALTSSASIKPMGDENRRKDDTADRKADVGENKTLRRLWFEQGKYVLFFRQVATDQEADAVIANFKQDTKNIHPDRLGWTFHLEIISLHWVYLKDLRNGKASVRPRREEKSLSVCDFVHEVFRSFSTTVLEFAMCGASER